jgi:hypothetical protein
MKTINKNYLEYCFRCGIQLYISPGKGLPFYSIIFKNHLRRVCPKCFPLFKNFWMG